MMNKTSWRGFALGLSLSIAYFVGCATARVTTPPVANAQAGAQRWEYFCTDGYNDETIMERANEAGAQGWEMIAGVGSTRVAGLWCFKRALP
jgi:hypothetical protein